jgi:hypothetical protein
MASPETLAAEGPESGAAAGTGSWAGASAAGCSTAASAEGASAAESTVTVSLSAVVTLVTEGTSSVETCPALAVVESMESGLSDGANTDAVPPERRWAARKKEIESMTISAGRTNQGWEGACGSRQRGRPDWPGEYAWYRSDARGR